MVKKVDWQSMTTNELFSALEQSVRDLYKARLDSASGQLKTPHTIQSKRKEIARIKTALHSKEKSSKVAANLSPEEAKAD